MLVFFPSKHHKCKIVCQSQDILSFTSVKNSYSGTIQEHLKKGKTVGLCHILPWREVREPQWLETEVMALQRRQPFYASKVFSQLKFGTKH